MVVNKIGFTLIELLIVVTIIILFSGMSLAYYNNFTSQKNLELVGQKMVELLQTAQKKSMTGDLSPGPSCQNFTGYEFQIDTSTTYELSFCCNNSCTTPLTTSPFTMPPNISVSFPAAPITVRYKQNGQGISMSQNLSDNRGNIILKNTQTSKCLNISVSDIGVITPTDEQYSC